MVDYDAAVAAVQDPNADPVFLAKIAYENPEFGANVAVNPRAYPGLLRWLAEFGDDRARRTVAQLGYAVPESPAGAVQPSQEPAEQDSPAPSYAPASAPENRPVFEGSRHDATPHDRPEENQPTTDQPAEAQPVQNPYGFTADIARTTTDQMQMAEIAQKAPELHASLALNPNLYPALVDWLAQLGDPAVNEALATRQSGLR